MLRKLTILLFLAFGIAPEARAACIPSMENNWNCGATMGFVAGDKNLDCGEAPAAAPDIEAYRAYQDCLRKKNGYYDYRAGLADMGCDARSLEAASKSGEFNGYAVGQKCSEADIETKNEKQIADCWQTRVLGGLYDLTGTATLNMYAKICAGALPFMMVAFAVWLALRLMAHLSSFTEENPNEVWNEVLQKLFLCFACGLIANSTETMLWALNSVVFPVYTALLELGAALLNGIDGKEPGGLTIFGKKIIGWGDSIGQGMTCRPNLAAAAQKASANAFPDAPKEMMGCLVCAVNTKLNVGFPIAFEVMKGGDNPGIGQKLLMILVGVIVYCSFLFVKLGFVFSLVDSIFKMAMVLCIFPILIMGFPFKKTRGWVGKGFLQILASAGFMMFIALLMTLAILAFQQVISKNPCLFGNTELCATEMAKDDEVKKYDACVEEADGDSTLIKKCKDQHPAGALKSAIKAEGAYDGISVTIVVLLLTCFLLLNSVKIAKDLTSSLIGEGVSDSFQKKLETVGRMLVDWIVGGAMGAMKKLAGNGAAGGAAGKDAGNKLADAGKEDKEDKDEEGGADAQLEQDGGSEGGSEEKEQ